MFEEPLLSIGVAISTIGIILYTLCNDFAFRKYDRLKNDYIILFDRILKEKKWIRWPFLKRKEIFKFTSGGSLQMDLTNPPLEFTIGKQKLKIDLPTTYEDMLDLPLKNYYNLKKFKILFIQQESSKKNKLNHNRIMSFLCLYDMWESIFYFKIFRFIRNIGILTICLGLIVIINPFSLILNSLI